MSAANQVMLQTKQIHAVVLFLCSLQFAEGCNSFKDFRQNRCSLKIFRNDMLVHLK